MKNLITVIALSLSFSSMACTLNTYDVDGKLYLENGKGASAKFLDFASKKCTVQKLQASKEFKNAILTKKVERSNKRLANMLAKLSK